MDTIMQGLLGFVIVQFIIICCLWTVNERLRKRPDKTVFTKLHDDAKKANKDLESLRRAFEGYRASNGTDRLVLDKDDALDADALRFLIAQILSDGAGAAGDVSNVQAIVEMIYGEIPPHLRKLWYGNDTKIAVWNRGTDVPNKLRKLLPKD